MIKAEKKYIGTNLAKYLADQEIKNNFATYMQLTRAQQVIVSIFIRRNYKDVWAELVDAGMAEDINDD